MIVSNSASAVGAAISSRSFDPGEAPLFIDNVISGNTGAESAIRISRNRPPVFNLNYIENECDYEVAVDEPPSPDTLEFTSNWWGTTNPDSIASLVYDCVDKPNRPWCIDYSSWCTDPSCSGQVTGVKEQLRPTSWGSLKSLFR
jgi:hypothetical protein